LYIQYNGDRAKILDAYKTNNGDISNDVFDSYFKYFKNRFSKRGGKRRHKTNRRKHRKSKRRHTKRRHTKRRR